MGLAGERNLNRIAGVAETPNRNVDVSLKHHVVGEDSGNGDSLGLRSAEPEESGGQDEETAEI